VIPLSEEDFVRVVHEVIVWKDFEKFHSFSIMVMSTSGWFRLTWPVYDDVFSMTFPKSVPKAASRPRIPRII